METLAENKEKTAIKSIASTILLIILLGLSMNSCSQLHPNTNDNNGIQYTSSNYGYIVINNDKILVVCKSAPDGHRAMTKRNWGLDGIHFTNEEDYLDSRPDLVNDLKSGITIEFIL